MINITIGRDGVPSESRISLGDQWENFDETILFDLPDEFKGYNKYVVGVYGKFKNDPLLFPLTNNKLIITQSLTQKSEQNWYLYVMCRSQSLDLQEGYIDLAARDGEHVFISKAIVGIVDPNYIDASIIENMTLDENFQIVYDDLLTLRATLESDVQTIKSMLDAKVDSFYTSNNYSTQLTDSDVGAIRNVKLEGVTTQDSIIGWNVFNYNKFETTTAKSGTLINNGDGSFRFKYKEPESSSDDMPESISLEYRMTQAEKELLLTPGTYEFDVLNEYNTNLWPDKTNCINSSVRLVDVDTDRTIAICNSWGGYERSVDITQDFIDDETKTVSFALRYYPSYSDAKNRDTIRKYVFYNTSQHTYDVDWFERITYTGGPTPNPGFPVQMTSIDKLDIRVLKKNLLNVESKCSFNITDLIPIRLKKDDIITISCGAVTKATPYPPGLALFDDDEKMIQYELLDTNKTSTITIKKDIVGARLYSEGVSSSNSPSLMSIVENLQIERGSTATEYEVPEEQSFSCDLPISMKSALDRTYCDYIDLDRGVLVQVVGEKTYNGDQSWTSNGSGVLYTIIDDALKANNSIVCDKYQTYIYSDSHGYNESNKLCLNYNGALCIRTEHTVESWIEFLKTNPFTVLYPLATPIEHELNPTMVKELQALHTYYGLTNINSNVPIIFNYNQHTDAWFDRKFEDGINEVEKDISGIKKDIVSINTKLKTVKPLILNSTVDYTTWSAKGDEALQAIIDGRQILVKVPNADGNTYTANFMPIIQYQLPNTDNNYLYLIYMNDGIANNIMTALGTQDFSGIYGQLKLALSTTYNSCPLK